jgi:hypothetical protein
MNARNRVDERCATPRRMTTLHYILIGRSGHTYDSPVIVTLLLRSESTDESGQRRSNQHSDQDSASDFEFEVKWGCRKYRKLLL